MPRAPGGRERQGPWPLVWAGPKRRLRGGGLNKEMDVCIFWEMESRSPDSFFFLLDFLNFGLMMFNVFIPKGLWRMTMSKKIAHLRSRAFLQSWRD